MSIPSHDHCQTVLEAFIADENGRWWNRMRSMFKPAPFRIDTCVASSEDCYHGVSYIVRHDGHPIAVFTKWDDCPETLVVGERPQSETPHRTFFERICAYLEARDIDLDYAGVPA